MVQLCTVWPFPDDEIRRLCANCHSVIVGELNMGQVVHEIRRALPQDIKVHAIQRYDGEILTPMQMVEKLEEVLP